LKFEKNWPYNHMDMKNMWIFIFEIWNQNFHFEIRKESEIPLERNEKINISSVSSRKFWNVFFEKLIFEIWNEKFHFLKLKIIWQYHQRKMKKFEINKSYISFMPPIIPLCHLCIPPIPHVQLCGIQLISTVESLPYWSFSNSGIGWYGPP
jgi:hypothetical protein